MKRDIVKAIASNKDFKRPNWANYAHAIMVGGDMAGISIDYAVIDGVTGEEIQLSKEDLVAKDYLLKRGRSKLYG